MADQVMIEGVPYLADAKGRLVAESLIRPHELLEDQLVRKMIDYARDLSAQIGRFKGHCFDDVASFMELLASNYGMTKRGAQGKGNVTFSSFDGQRRVTIQVADQLTFGPGLQVAKEMVDACLTEWSADARPELRVLVQEAFRTDKAGHVSTDAVFRLLRMEIEDAAWQRAMQALRESVRIEGSKSYIRFHERDATGRWTAITIDLASAVAPAVGAPSKPEAAALPLIDIAATQAGGYVVASGSLPASAPADFYARLAREASRNGARFVLDTSGAALKDTFAEGGVFLAKPSQGELEELVGAELDEKGVVEAAQSLVGRGQAKMVAVSMGAQGALLASDAGVIRRSAPRVRVRSAIGAGDSFLGAMIWALGMGWATEDAFELAIAAGAAAVLTSGTQLCRKADIEALYPMPG
mgnify:CR=1 FL=1